MTENGHWNNVIIVPLHKTEWQMNCYALEGAAATTELRSIYN